jgi:phenylacetate-CoA ligase
MWELGLRPGDYVADIDAVLRSVGHLCFRDAGAIPIFFNHDAADLPRFVEWSLKYRPTFMFLLSSVLIYGLARLEAERGIDMRDVFSSYKCLAYGGEPMGKQAGALMERWQAPVYQFSSLGDCGTGWECRARDGFHAWEDLVLFEVVDPLTGEPTPDGERGEMVITSLVDRTDPLVRFRSGDLVRWTAEPCACGRTHARYWPLGRVTDETIIAGRSVMPRDIWSAIEETPETAAGMFQIIRPDREMDALRLRVGYDGAPDLAALCETLSAAVERATGIRPEIELIPASEIVKLGPPHKIPRTAKS